MDFGRRYAIFPGKVALGLGRDPRYSVRVRLDRADAISCIDDIHGRGQGCPSQALLEQDIRPRRVLVGDVMLDRYVWGDVERISPEAPIPICGSSGGSTAWAAPAAWPRCWRPWELQTILAAVTGDDEEGRIVGELLDNLEVNRRLMLAVGDRATTVKQRLLGRLNTAIRTR